MVSSSQQEVCRWGSGRLSLLFSLPDLATEKTQGDDKGMFRYMASEGIAI